MLSAAQCFKGFLQLDPDVKSKVKVKVKVKVAVAIPTTHCERGSVCRLNPLAVVACAIALASPAWAGPPAPASTTAPGWWRDDVFYEIYPRSFADSNGDGTGDLKGIIAKLDDLRALGVDALWLTPIHPTPSQHGYDVLDYEGVAKDLGTIADVEMLTREAHARGMHVVLDFVLNHTSVQHRWFRERPDFYVWRDAPDPRWHRPWDDAPVFHRDEKTGRHYLGLFWSGMPDLNLANPDVVAAMTKAMRFWLERGVDGFRIDAARHLVETETSDGVKMTDTAATHNVMRTLRREIHKTHPHAVLVAEAWASSAEIAAYTDEFDLVFSFGVAGGLVDALKLEERAPLVEALQGAEAAFRDRSREAPFLTNHDMVRVMRQLDGAHANDVGAKGATESARARARLGAATLMALPGTPFLYYGEEIGMQGLEGRDDAFKRTKLEWSEVKTQRANESSLWRTYQSMIALRHAQPALTRGTATRPEIKGGGRGAFALLRTPGTGPGAAEERERTASTSSRILFVANFSKEEARDFVIALTGSPRVISGSTLDVVARDGALHIAKMPPHSFAFIALD